MDKGARIYVAGHTGLLGSALVRRLEGGGFRRLILPSRRPDLRDPAAVGRFFRRERPEFVFLAAGTVGGIEANRSRPADFIRDNLSLQLNVLHAAHETGVRKLLFIGCACMYPKAAPQPLREEALFTGPVEPTSEAYATAKLAGLRMCQAYNAQHRTRFIACIGASLYGPGDDFEPEGSHVLAALVRRFHEAKRRGLKEVRLWGSGRPLREFLHADDMADACLLLMRRHEGSEPVNVGSGAELSIARLAELTAEATGWRGRISWDRSRPDGVARKLLDGRRLRALGWKPRIPLREGLAATCRWYASRRS